MSKTAVHSLLDPKAITLDIISGSVTFPKVTDNILFKAILGDQINLE